MGLQFFGASPNPMPLGFIPSAYGNPSRGDAQRAVRLCAPEMAHPDEASSGPAVAALAPRDELEPVPKRARLPDFEPTEVGQAKKYVFAAPEPVTKYMERHFRSPLTDEQRRVMHEAHPRPDTDAAFPPKVDESVLRWAGQRYPKALDQQLVGIQRDLLAATGPATCMWSSVCDMEAETSKDEEAGDLMVPAADVKEAVQRTLVLLGDLMVSVNSIRRQVILEAVDKEVAKVGKEVRTPSSGRHLFGDTFIEDVTSKLKSGAALQEAQKIVRQASAPHSSHKPFRKGGFAVVRSRAPRSFHPSGHFGHPSRSSHQFRPPFRHSRGRTFSQTARNPPAVSRSGGGNQAQ